jgi:hypothetical protein
MLSNRHDQLELLKQEVAVIVSWMASTKMSHLSVILMCWDKDVVGRQKGNQSSVFSHSNMEIIEFAWSSLQHDASCVQACGACMIFATYLSLGSILCWTQLFRHRWEILMYSVDLLGCSMTIHHKHRIRNRYYTNDRNTLSQQQL